MVSHWDTNKNWEEEGVIVLNTGKVIDLSRVPGVGYPEARLKLLTIFLQREIDTRIPIAEHHVEDNRRIRAEAGDVDWFTEIYQDKIYIDGFDIVYSSANVTLKKHDGKLYLQFFEKGSSGVDIWLI